MGVCAVVPCSYPGQDCLSYQRPEGHLQGVTVEMSGDASPSTVPEVLATDGSYPEVLLTPGRSDDGFNFTNSGSSAELSASTTSKILSALIYGRRFDQDQLPYSCGQPTPGPTPAPTPPSPKPGKCHPCTPGGYTCDEWIAWNPRRYSCPELERDYGCDCSGCRCHSEQPTFQV